MPLRPSPSARPKRCYVASPLGFTAPGRTYYRNVLLPALASVVEPIDPWTLVAGSDQPPSDSAARRQLAADIGRANAAAIRACDVLVAYLDGQELDSGTAAEVGYAAARGTPCLGLRTDLRTMGELDTLVNLQVEAFIVESGGKLVGSLDDLVQELALRGFDDVHGAP